MKRPKRLRKGHTTLLVDEGGVPRDATGHRTDRPARYGPLGHQLWRADEMKYVLGQRVRAKIGYGPMQPGEAGTILDIPEYVHKEYIVLPDSLIHHFRLKRSGVYLARVPEHYLEPE